MKPERYAWALTLAVLLLGSGCGSQAQDQGRKSAQPAETQPPVVDASKKSPAPKPPSADAEAPTGEPAKDKDKRGNTPPGSDRAGSAPASGAIVDPSGATQK